MMRSFIYKNCHYLLSGLRGLNCRGALPYLGSGVAPSARGFSGDRSGVVAVLVGLALPVLVGAMGLAAETSYWYVHQRGMQNAADAAAIAAATNGTSTYAAEAQAVVAGFYPNGLGTITVTAANPNTASGCATPAGLANSCYTVTVSDKVPLFLSQVVGYAGNGKGATSLAATAVVPERQRLPLLHPGAQRQRRNRPCLARRAEGQSERLQYHVGQQRHLHWP